MLNNDTLDKELDAFLGVDNSTPKAETEPIAQGGNLNDELDTFLSQDKEKEKPLMIRHLDNEPDKEVAERIKLENDMTNMSIGLGAQSLQRTKSEAMSKIGNIQQIIPNSAASVDARLAIIDEKLSNLEKKVVGESNRDAEAIPEVVSAFVPAGAIRPRDTQRFASHETLGGKAIRDARDKIRSIRENDLASGIAEGFDWISLSTMGLNDLVAGVHLNSVLKKKYEGKELTEREQLAYDIYEITQELESIQQETGGSSIWNTIGKGVGFTAEVASSMPIGVGLVGSGVKMTSLGARAGMKLTKEAFKEGVAAGLKRGLIETTKIAGRSAANVTRAEVVGILSAPITPTSWSAFIEKRNEQYKLNNGNLEFAEKEAWKDLANTWIEQSQEIGSEVMGTRIASVVGGAAKNFGRLIRLDKVADKIGIGSASRTFMGLRKPAFVREMEKSIGFAGFVGEPLSEFWGDVVSESFKKLITGDGSYENLISSDYWLQTLGVCSLYGGAVSIATSPATIAEYKKSNIYAFSKARGKALSEISDRNLRNELLSISSIDDIEVAAKEFARLPWNNYTKADIASAADFIRADYVEKVLLGDANESKRMNSYEGIALTTSELAYRGEDGRDFTEDIISIDTDSGRYVVISGVVDANADNMLQCMDANGKIVPIHSSKIQGVFKHSLQQEMGDRYQQMFASQVEQDRQTDIVDTFKEMKNPSREDVQRVMNAFGVKEHQAGETVTLVDGRQGVVESLEDDGTYIINAPTDMGAQLLSVPFYDVLAEDEAVAEAQSMNYAMRTFSDMEIAMKDDLRQSSSSKNTAAEGTKTTKFAVNEPVYTADGRQAIIREINDDGTYTIDYNTNPNARLEDMQLDVVSESDLSSEITTIEEDVVAQETPSTQVTMEATPYEAEVKDIPTQKDGSVDYNAISDPKQYAELFAKDMGGVEIAATHIQRMTDATRKQVEKLIAKGESLTDANEVVRNNKEIAALNQRLSFYGDVLDVLQPTDKTADYDNIDRQGNPIGVDGSLIIEEVATIDEIEDRDFIEPYRSIKLPNIPERISNALGIGAKPIVIKKNIFERNSVAHSDLTPAQSRDIIYAALYNTSLYGQNQKRKKPNNWVVISVPVSEGTNKLVLLEINENKDNVEIIHWHYTDNRGIEKIKRQAEREDGQLLILPPVDSGEVGALSDPTLNLFDESKDNAKNGKIQIKSEENRPKTEAGLVTNEYSEKLTAEEAESIDRMAKLFGLSVVFVDKVEAANGAKANADISGNEVRIAYENRDRAIGFLVGHEFTHRMQDLSPEQYAAFKDSVKQFMGEEAWNALVEHTLRNYRRQNVPITRDAVEDEVVADYVGALVNDYKAFDAYLASLDDKSLLQTILDVLRAIRDFIFNAEVEGMKDITDMIKKLDTLIASAAEAQAKGVEVKDGGTRNALSDTPSLVGVHNISLDKLRKVIKMGGLANPSVAVIDVDKQMHDDYGDYSLILPKNMVDARQGKNAGTWAGDAWTPTYPQVVKRMNDDKAISRFYKDIDALPEAMRSRVRLDFDSFMDGRSANALAYWYLFEKGNAPEMVLVPSRYSNDVTNAVSEATKGSFSMFNLTPEERAECLDAYIAVKFDGDRAAFEAEMQARIERLTEAIETKKSDRVKKWAQDTIDSIKEYGFDYDDVAKFIRDVEYDGKEKGKVNVDATIMAAQERINESNLAAEYDAWRNNLDERYGIDEFIFDGYTNSGNRRYLPHTVENASKWMKKQGRQGAVATFPSFGTFIAVSIPKMTTLESIRKRKALLGKSKEEYDTFREKWENVYYELGKKLQPDAKGFEDYGYWRLIEAVGHNNPKEFIKKKYGIELSEEDMAKFDEMVNAIRTEYPARYFETKFERPLQLSDFTAAVVPNDIPLDVESRLKDAGVEVIEYEKGDNASRAEAMQKASAMENVRFSLPVIQGLSDALNEYKVDGDIATFVEKVREVNDKVALGHPMITSKLDAYEDDGDAEWFAEKIEELVGDYDGGYAPYTAGGVRYSIVTDQIEYLFNEAVAGNLTGKPIAIGVLTQEGKDYLEKLSGLKFKDKVSFTLNPSDLVHIHNDHFGGNEKDKGNNIPLTTLDIKRIVDVISFPTAIIYGKEKNSGRNLFYFLMDTGAGTYNLLEVYSDRKGNLSTKTYYKTKKDAAQRVMELKNSLLPTSETYSGAILSDTKIPQIFEIPKVSTRNSLISPEMDASYLDAVERGDMEAARKMVMEAAKLSMPNTKVVDDDGNPKVVYHGTPNNFNAFSKEMFGTSTDRGIWGNGFYFSDSEQYAKTYEKRGDKQGRTLTVFLNIENPLFISLRNGGNEGAMYFHELMEKHFTDDIYEDATRTDELMSVAQERLTADIVANGYDGIVVEYTNHIDTEYVAFNPNQIKSADPVTYDDNGNIIPLSERFNPEKEDIRYSLSAPTFYSNAEYAVRNIKQEKATPEQWLKMIEKAGGLKAGEDKWLGLSDWFKASDKKTLTKDEVLQYIADNNFVIEENNTMHAVNVTDSMRESVMQGQPRFSLQETNDRFNEELDAFKEGVLKGNLHLGMPRELLQKCGVNATEIYITPKTLKDHLKKHGLSVDDIRDLPLAINSPLMVYEWGTKAKSKIIITQISKDDQRITVAIKMERGGVRMAVNELASVHGKDVERLVSEMLTTKTDFGKDNLKYVNKEVAMQWLGIAPPEGASSLTDAQQRIANIIQNFENPKIEPRYSRYSLSDVISAEEQVRIFMRNKHLKAKQNIRKKYRTARQVAKLDYDEKRAARQAKIRDMRTNSAKVEYILGEVIEATMPYEHQAYAKIARGEIKMPWETLSAEIGVKKGEKRIYAGITKGANPNNTFDSVVHQWWGELNGYENNIDTQDLRNALIEALRTAPSSTRALQELNAIYDKDSATLNDTMDDLERMEAEEIASEDTRYAEEETSFEADKSAYIAHFEREAAYFSQLEVMDATVVAIRKRLEKTKMVLEVKQQNKYYKGMMDARAVASRERLEKAEMALERRQQSRYYKGLMEAIAEVKQAVKDVISSKTIDNLDRNELRRIIDKIDNVRSLSDVDAIVAELENITLTAMTRHQNKDLQRMLKLRLPNGVSVEEWVGEQVKAGRMSKADADAMLRDKWKGRNASGVNVAKWVDNTTAEIMRWVAAKIGPALANDKLVVAESEIKANSARIEELEQKSINTANSTALPSERFTDADEIELRGRILYGKFLNAMAYQKSIAILQDERAEIYEHYHKLSTVLNETLDRIERIDDEKRKAEETEFNADKSAHSEAARDRHLARNMAALVEVKRQYKEAMDATNEAFTTLLTEGREALSLFRREQEAHKAMVINMGCDALDVNPRTVPNKPSAWERVRAFNRVSFNAPYYTFQTTLKEIDRRAPNGEGRFYNYFMNGVINCTDKMISQHSMHIEQVAEQMRKILDIKGSNDADIISKVIDLSDSTPLLTVIYGGEDAVSGIKAEEKVITLSNALYIIAMWRQPQYRDSMIYNGFTEEMYNKVYDAVLGVDDRYIKFINWVNESLLPETRLVYDKVHQEMFGTSMANERNYFPAKLVGYEKKEDVSVDDVGNLPSTITGAIVARVHNRNMIDLNMNYFKVLMGHLQEMDQWSSFAPITRDLNALASNTEFRSRCNAVMPGLNADRSGKGSLFSNFKTTASIAVNCYRPKSTALDDLLLAGTRGWAGANITWRGSTAIKQLASSPVFAVYALDPVCLGIWAKNSAATFVTQRKTLEWAIANSPMFKKRWEGKFAGMDIFNTKVNEDGGYGVYDKVADSKIGRGVKAFDDAITKFASDWGMTPNAYIDAMTVANGIKTVYEYELHRFKKRNGNKPITEEQKREAIIKAEIAFNATQQSSEGAFVSEWQSNRTFATRLITVYQNSAYGFHRLKVSALNEFAKQLTRNSEYKANIREVYGREANKVLRDARLKAGAQLAQGIVGDLLFVLMGAAGTVPLFRVLGGGDDEGDEKALLAEAAKGALFNIVAGGFAGGNILSSLTSGYSVSFGGAWDALVKDVKSLMDYDLFSLPSVYHGLNIISTYRYGVDFDTLKNIAIGIEGVIEGAATGDGKSEAVMKLLNVPQSQISMVAGKRRPEETLQEYITRRLRTESIGSTPEVDEDGNIKADQAYWDSPFTPKKYFARQYKSDYETAYRRNVIVGMADVDAYNSYLDTEEEYKKVVEAMGWTPDATPNKKATKGGVYVAPIEGLGYEDYKEVKRLATRAANFAKKVDRFVGTDENYYKLLVEMIDAKQELINKYNEL